MVGIAKQNNGNAVALSIDSTDRVTGQASASTKIVIMFSLHILAGLSVLSFSTFFCHRYFPCD